MNPLKNCLFFIYPLVPNICQHFIGQYVFYQNKHSTLSTKTCCRNYLQKKKKELSHFGLLLQLLNALNVYQIYLYEYLNFMYKFKNQQTPKIFNDIIDTPIHQYPTKFSKANFSIKRFPLKSTKYSISVRGTKIWNEFWTNEENAIGAQALFLSKIKSPLYCTKNERGYF